MTNLEPNKNKSRQTGDSNFTTDALFADCFRNKGNLRLSQKASLQQIDILNILIGKGPQLRESGSCISLKHMGDTGKDLDTKSPKQECNYEILDYLGGTISF
ncbi:hypothetical protein DYH55_19940 [Methylovirgula sp. 4M-Z18]|nr:hypothetical protein DYH55_19940 [Methylovirgula sp. 4M-Z18]